MGSFGVQQLEWLTRDDQGFLNRPLHKLHPLEVREECLNEVETRKGKTCKGESNQVGEEARPQRSRQAVALDSKWKTSAMLEP